jgi:hypothetical protein
MGLEPAVKHFCGSRGPVRVYCGVGALAPGAGGVGSTGLTTTVSDGVGALALGRLWTVLDPDGDVGSDPEQAVANRLRPIRIRFTHVTPFKRSHDSQVESPCNTVIRPEVTSLLGILRFLFFRNCG